MISIIVTNIKIIKIFCIITIINYFELKILKQLIPPSLIFIFSANENLKSKNFYVTKKSNSNQKVYKHF